MIERQAEQFRDTFEGLKQQIQLRIVGLDEIVESVLSALFLGGHVLLEGVPGLGKTLLVRTLAEVLDLQFSRIQFTPDLMPADITGTNMIVEGPSGQKMFQFQKGPIFTHILLADEINRATPKTQSALLEAMQEHGVTMSGQRHILEDPFFVLATQNPIEMEGTYPLPEAQMDRFLYKLIVPFPNEKEMLSILNRTTTDETVRLQVITNREKIHDMCIFALQVPVAETVMQFASKIVFRTHPDHPDAPETVKKYVRYGSSPRGAQALILSAKVRALRDRRYNAAFDDVLASVLQCLRHRLILNIEGLAENVSADHILQQIIAGLEPQKS